MKVFLHGSEGRTPEAFHVKFLCPAGHLRGQEVPHDWVDAENKPVTFQVEFIHGEAEVDDALGRYLVETGQAFRTRLVVPGYFRSAFPS